LLAVTLLANAIFILINNIKSHRKFKKWDSEFEKKRIKEQFNLIAKSSKYELALRGIRAELNKNQNGSVDNLSKKIKKMIPEDII
jgi:hypothetical protein